MTHAVKRVQVAAELGYLEFVYASYLKFRVEVHMAVALVSNRYELIPATKPEEPSTGALRQLLGALAPSDDRVLAQSERTAKTFERVMAGMQEHLASIVAENQRLRGQLVASEGQHRALAILHAAEVEALKQKVSSSEQLVVAMRQEMQESSRNAEQQLHQAIAAREVAVQTATQAGEARLTAERARAEAEHKQIGAQFSAEKRKVHRLFEEMRGVHYSFFDRTLVPPTPPLWTWTVNLQATLTVDEARGLMSSHFKEYLEPGTYWVRRDCRGGGGDCPECNARIAKDMAEPILYLRSTTYLDKDWMTR